MRRTNFHVEERKRMQRVEHAGLEPSFAQDASSFLAKHIFQNDLLCFPKQCHGHGKGKQDERNEKPEAAPVQYHHDGAQPEGQSPKQTKSEIGTGEEKRREDEIYIQNCKLAGLQAKSLIWQHRAEALQHAIETAEK